MAKPYDKILVVDLEATCWARGDSPPDESSEIIQVGSCYLFLGTLAITLPVTTFCAPTRSKVSDYCTALTGIEPGMLDGAPSFAELVQHLRDRGRNRRIPWASWGQYDRVCLASGCAEAGLRYPLRVQHTDIKHLAGLMLRGTPTAPPCKDPSLASALEHLGMTFQGCPHDAGDDAVNAARILRVLLSAARRGVPDGIQEF